MELSSEVIIEVMGNITEKEDSKPLSDKDKKKMSDIFIRLW